MSAARANVRFYCCKHGRSVTVEGVHEDFFCPLCHAALEYLPMTHGLVTYGGETHDLEGARIEPASTSTPTSTSTSAPAFTR